VYGVHLNRARILAAAVELADEVGYDALSMRLLADRLGVVPMALYKHVRNRDELVDDMVDVLLGEIGTSAAAGDAVPASAHWKARARDRILAARGIVRRHPWAWRAIETRASPGPAALDHQEALIRILRDGGLSVALTHHVMHALGSRIWGFTQDVFDAAPPPSDPALRAQAIAMMSARWPAILESASYAAHDTDSIVGPGCDDEAEFAFALDLLLDGAERLDAAGWTPAQPPAGDPVAPGA
jgi:AcrR family transcriptional regulator